MSDKRVEKNELAVLSELGLEVGQKVIAARDIVQEASDDFPAHLLATKGTVLIVRGAWTHDGDLPVRVSHEHITDNSFRVSMNEIRV
jgi:hypothetical protein